MGNRREYLINNIVKICQKLDQKGFGANHDGNVTVKFEDTLLATPTAESKGAITTEMIITVGMDGKKIEGIGKPFSEIELHLAAYRARPDVAAVVHAHPPFATARGLADKPLKTSLPEAIVSIGREIPVINYAMPGAAENVEMVIKALNEVDVFMIQGNGVLASGGDLEQAYLRLELVEHLSKIDFYAAHMGKSFEIPDRDADKLYEKHAALFRKCRAPAWPPRRVENSKPSGGTELREIIKEEIRKALDPSPAGSG